LRALTALHWQSKVQLVNLLVARLANLLTIPHVSRLHNHHDVQPASQLIALLVNHQPNHPGSLLRNRQLSLLADQAVNLQVDRVASQQLNLLLTLQPSHPQFQLASQHYVHARIAKPDITWMLMQM